jgi:HAD superfamily hydrolase (TIGR01484 family)
VKPLSAWPVQERRQISGVFTDIDDTLTTQGSITPDALQALIDLKAAGLHVIPITGRSMGWCAPLALGDPAQGSQAWPVDAIVAENGAAAFAPKDLSKNELKPLLSKRKQLSNLYQQSEAQRTENFAKMQQVAAQVLREVQQARLSQDSAGRETDIAFDYNEFVHLDPDTVQQVLAALQHAGMTTTASSIHLHGCFGDFNKWQGACWIVRELFHRDLAQELDRWVFVGDSGNDQAMFEHFTHSVGVANIRRFEAGLAHKPRYITPSERGAGFAEVAQAVLNARTA